MRHFVIMIALGCMLGLTGCATPGPVDTAQAPPGFGFADPANAIQYSAWAFALPSRTANNPVAAATAVAALDYVAGQLNTNPAWRSGSPIINAEMLRAREAVRRVLGVAPDATSQQVVNSMVIVSNDLQQGNRSGALNALGPPVYTLGPEQTLAVLTNLPHIQAANVATSHALSALSDRACPLGCLQR